MLQLRNGGRAPCLCRVLVGNYYKSSANYKYCNLIGCAIGVCLFIVQEYIFFDVAVLIGIN